MIVPEETEGALTDTFLLSENPPLACADPLDDEVTTRGALTVLTICCVLTVCLDPLEPPTFPPRRELPLCDVTLLE